MNSGWLDFLKPNFLKHRDSLSDPIIQELVKDARKKGLLPKKTLVEEKSIACGYGYFDSNENRICLNQQALAETPIQDAGETLAHECLHSLQNKYGHHKDQEFPRLLPSSRHYEFEADTESIKFVKCKKCRSSKIITALLNDLLTRYPLIIFSKFLSIKRKFEASPKEELCVDGLKAMNTYASSFELWKASRTVKESKKCPFHSLSPIGALRILRTSESHLKNPITLPSIGLFCLGTLAGHKLHKSFYLVPILSSALTFAAAKKTIRNIRKEVLNEKIKKEGITLDVYRDIKETKLLERSAEALKKQDKTK